MSISHDTPDFAPNLKGYTGQGAFRFWCQKVLPIVYDDSLSYYELLNKVVNYLNNVISDVSTMGENIEGLYDGFVDLQGYVDDKILRVETVVNAFEDFINNYFTTLDVQDEINQKLDEMASSGELTTILTPVVRMLVPSVVTDWLDDNITPTTPAIDRSLTVEGAGADSKVVGDALTDIIADEYDEVSGVYSIGDYCLESHKLYRCKVNITTPETFTVSHWDLVSVSGEIGVLNTGLSINAFNIANSLGAEIGAWRLTQRNETRVSGMRFTVKAGDTIVFKAGTVFQQLLIEKYDTQGGFIGQLGWFIGDHTVQLDFTGGVTLVYRKPQNENILVSEYDAKTYVIRADSELKQELSYIDNECEIFNVGFGDIIQGGYNRYNEVTPQLNRVRLKSFLPVSAGDRVLFWPGLLTKQILIGVVNEFLPVYETTWTGGHVDYTCEHTGNLMIMVRKDSSATEFPAEQFDAKIVIIRSTKHEIGSKKYNGYMFRSNYVPGIGFHRDNNATFTKSYSDLIAEYDKMRNRITTIYANISSEVPKPITVTKNEIITTDSGYTIYSYTFRPAYPKKRIMLQAGVHGNEYEGVFALFYLLRFMYTSDYVYPRLKELVNSCEIVVIPVVNPYGFEHNTKNNADDVNVYETYAQTTNEPKEMQAIKTVATTGTYDYEMDIHTDPYTAKKGCYGYAYVNGDMYEFLYKEILNFRDILYQEFSMFESRYYNSDDKDIIVGRILDVNNGGGSVGYFYRLGIPANLIEIATGASGSGTPFTETGSSEMMRIAVDWYGNVLLKAYEQITAQ